MLAIKGYYNGREIVPLEKVEFKPNQKIIITILDEYVNPSDKNDKPFLKYIGKLSDESFNEINKALEATEKVDANEW